MLLIVLYSVIGLIIVNRLEIEGHFGDYVEEHDLLCVSIDDRRQTSEILYGLMIWIWPVIVIKSAVQLFL